MGDTADFGPIVYLVLKKNQTPEKEALNPYASWFVAAKSAATFGGWDMGDTYIRDIAGVARKVWTNPGDEVIPVEIQTAIDKI